MLVDFFPTSGMQRCYLLPTDAPEALSCTAWQTSREENDHPATWQHMTPQCSSVQGEDSEEEVESYAPSTTLHSRPSPPRLPSFWICKESDTRPALCDEWGSPKSYPHHLWTAEMVFYYKGIFKNSGRNATIRMEDFAEKWLQCTDFNTVVFFYL